MINTSDLKIGNIIKVKHDNKWKTAMVIAVFPSWVIAKNPYIGLNDSFDPDHLHAAHISREWLEENGFKNDQRYHACINKQVGKDHKKVSLRDNENGEFQFVSGHSMTPISKATNKIHVIQNICNDISDCQLFSLQEISIILSASQE